MKKLKVKLGKDKVFKRDLDFNLDICQLLKVIESEIRNQKRAHEESKCKKCNGAGKLWASGSFVGHSYCICVAGSRIKLNETVMN